MQKIQCLKCGDHKDVSEFYSYSIHKNGVTGRCRCCMNGGYQPEYNFEMTEKKCFECGVFKDMNEYRIHSKTKDGRYRVCSECINNKHGVCADLYEISDIDFKRIEHRSKSEEIKNKIESINRYSESKSCEGKFINNKIDINTKRVCSVCYEEKRITHFSPSADGKNSNTVCRVCWAIDYNKAKKTHYEWKKFYK